MQWTQPKCLAVTAPADRRIVDDHEREAGQGFLQLAKRLRTIW
jgi:hypothetical protein